MREMKDSGIEWIGMIPADWNIVRIGNQYTERKTKVSDRDYPPLSVTMKGILPQLATAAKTDAHDDRKLVCKGDFAINSRSDRRGSCGISAYDGSVSLINTILQPQDEMNPEYYDWLFHSTMFSDEFYKWGHGIVDDLWTTNWQDMKRISIPEPSLKEQQRIADFLDHKCAEIDAVIEKTKATVEEYKKLKQSVITEAVTKGIRGDRPMKDSGIKWIGDIPTHWKTIKVKWLLNERKERSEDGEEEPLSMSQRRGLIPTKDMDMIPNMAASFVGAKLVHIGDLVFNKLKAHLGVFAVSKYDGLVSPDYAVYYSTGIADVKYLEYLFKTPQYIAEFRKKSSGVGAGLTRLYTDDLFSIYCSLPPAEEQEEIVAYLDKKCAEIDSLISKKTALFEEMEMYKKSVIYEYVTGKKEVGTVGQSATTIIYPYFPAVLSTKKARFAQAVLMSRILDKCRKKMGRVKLEKMLYTIETSIGFDFDTEYVRQTAGPLDESIYDCEAIISKSKWYTKKESKYGVSYTPAKDNAKYKKYYARYFSDYDSEIERIIGVFMDYNADQAEIIATLFAAWNDFIIDQRQFTDEELVDEVLNNWNDSKKRFSKDVWLRAIEQMRQNNIVPKGYGKRTVIKN